MKNLDDMSQDDKYKAPYIVWLWCWIFLFYGEYGFAFKQVRTWFEDTVRGIIAIGMMIVGPVVLPFFALADKIQFGFQYRKHSKEHYDV